MTDEEMRKKEISGFLVQIARYIVDDINSRPRWEPASAYKVSPETEAKILEIVERAKEKNIPPEELFEIFNHKIF